MIATAYLNVANISSRICENCGQQLTPVSMEVQRIIGDGKKTELWCTVFVGKELHGSG